VPRELSVLCRKCLEREPGRRYPTMAAVAEDLARYLRNEPILAAEPGVVERARKWSKRNPTASAVLATVTAGVVVAGWLANAEAVARREATALAASEAQSRSTAQRTVQHFNQLANVVKLDGLLAEQEALWLTSDAASDWSRLADALQAWLAGPFQRLLDQRPEIEATLADLRRQALPLGSGDGEANQRSAPEYAELQRQKAWLMSLRRAQAISVKDLDFVETPLSPEWQGRSARHLRTAAWARVAPLPEQADIPWPRSVHGEESLGLALARAAVARVSAGDRTVAKCTALEALAWALLANAQDGDVAAVADAAIAAVGAGGEEHRSTHERDKQELSAAIAERADRMAVVESRVAALQAAVDARRIWRFRDDAQGDSTRFLHDALVDLLSRLDELATNARASVESRLCWARQIAAATSAHPNAPVTWATARAAIALADGVVASAAYAGRDIVIPEQGWAGLVPIRMNPVTKLWEFYDLRSAWDGEQPASEIEIPRHQPDGSIVVTSDTGIVFVLLPGGTVRLGAQKDDPDAPFYAPAVLFQDIDVSTVRDVKLDPFLLARHEVTQGQWFRLWAWDKALRAPSSYAAGGNVLGSFITGAHPVEQVDWAMCDRMLSRHGMMLPTEAQWEYGCRGGTTTAWNVDRKALASAANLASAEAVEADAGWECEDWFDGRILHSPVGSYAANAFGLFDVHGNVFEWVREFYGEPGGERSGDGQRVHLEGVERCIRGGCFAQNADMAQSAYMAQCAPTVRVDHVGVRAARAIRR
jgi:formylglycine-generating enzyme required for sulfatase activity